VIVYKRLEFDPRIDEHSPLFVGLGFPEQLLRDHYILKDNDYLATSGKGSFLQYVRYRLCLAFSFFLLVVNVFIFMHR